MIWNILEMRKLVLTEYKEREKSKKFADEINLKYLIAKEGVNKNELFWLIWKKL